MKNDKDVTRWSYGDVKKAETSGMEYQILYPEIFYQVQPYIMEACDQLDASGTAMPSREVLRAMGDRIERQFEVPGTSEMARAVTDAVPGALRSRGLFRDLLDILLLTELFGRRRRRYY